MEIPAYVYKQAKLVPKGAAYASGHALSYGAPSVRNGAFFFARREEQSGAILCFNHSAPGIGYNASVLIKTDRRDRPCAPREAEYRTKIWISRAVGALPRP